uniref:Draxin n=1 Tax=Callorhinchus milii TaxID=7868 RepID=A0A4W3HCH7_CALMI
MAHWHLLSPFLLFLLTFDAISQVRAFEAGTRGKKSTAKPPTSSSNNLQRAEHSHKHGAQRKDKVRRLVTRVLEAGGPEEESAGLASLTPVRVEMGSRERPAGLRGERTEMYPRFFPQELNYPIEQPGTKGKRHREKKGSRRERARHKGAGKFPDAELIPFFKDVEIFQDWPQSTASDQPSTTAVPPSIPMVTTTLVTTITTEEVPVAPPVGKRKQVAGWRVREVNPTLDMTLFDWTDYEDLKPESWPAAKKEKRRSKNMSYGNLTSVAGVEPCDHHLDCLSGSCCDLRQHICKPHNRGLNNKCYDDCMCAEGLRCYAKFHRNRRVTRRRGRCVEPDSANGDQGSFITV